MTPDLRIYGLWGYPSFIYFPPIIDNGGFPDFDGLSNDTNFTSKSYSKFDLRRALLYSNNLGFTVLSPITLISIWFYLSYLRVVI